MNASSPRPRISVIVPVYNAQAFLPACIDSLAAQSYASFELIFVDDGSTDGSAGLCEDFARRDARVKLVRQANAGVAAARNRGLSQATGDYVTFVDADDWVDPTLLSNLAQAADAHDCDLAVSGLAWHFPDGRVESQQFDALQVAATPREAGDLVLQLEAKGLIHGPYQKLFRRSLIEAHGLRFPPLSFGEDTLFNLACLAHVGSLVGVPAVDYHYRRNADSLSVGRQRRYGEIMALLEGRRSGFAALAAHMALDEQAVRAAIAPTCMLNHMTALYAAYSPRHLLPRPQRMAALRAFKASSDYAHFVQAYRPGELRNRAFKFVVTALPGRLADAALQAMLWAKYRRQGRAPA